MMFLSMRVLASSLSPVALMRLSEIDDPDELLKKVDRNQIVIESKYDGWKAQAIKEGGSVRLFSRRGEEKTGNFPEIVKALSSAMPDGTLAEGELVYWHDGKQDVTKVQSVAGSASDTARDKASALPGKFKFHLYDILWLKGKDVSGQSFSERRKLLESNVKTSESVQFTKTYTFSDWQKAMNKAVDEGGEGIVLKLKGEKYHWKPGGETEPKPADVMFKYKGGRGKSDSDDYVVYDSEMTDTGKLKALFGQNYKGKLYHISEISNFSADNEGEIKSRLKKGPFVIEIGFQERVPKGLRHQKFIRFRDDKKPKDATMHEFHAEHISGFEPAKKQNALRAIAQLTPSAPMLIDYLRSLVKTVGSVKGITSGLSSVPGVDIQKSYKIMAANESNNRYTIGDAGTSFGTVQVRIDSMAYGLAADPHLRRVSGMSSNQLKQIASSWIKALGKVNKVIRSGQFWKSVPVDKAAVLATMKKRGRTLKRMEGTKIRHFPGGKPGYVTVGRDGTMRGYALNLDAIGRIPGFRMTPQARAKIDWIMRRFVTGAVVKNAVSKVVAEQEAPQTFAQFKRVFKPSRVNRTPALRALVDRVAQRNFTKRAQAVATAVKAAGYNTTAPGAFNIYQLIYMANAGGVGQIKRFLGLSRSNKPKFKPRRIPRGVLHSLRRGNPSIEKVTGIKSVFPPNAGMGGFEKHQVVDDPAVPRREESVEEKRRERAVHMGEVIKKWLNFEHAGEAEKSEANISYIGIARHLDPPVLIIWTHGRDADALQEMMPSKIFGMKIDIQNEPSLIRHKEFEEETPTTVEPFARMSPHLFGRFSLRLQEQRAALIDKVNIDAKKDLGIETDEEASIRSNELQVQFQRRLADVSELDLRRRVLKQVVEEEGLSEEEVDRILGSKELGLDDPEKALLPLSSREPGPLTKQAFMASGTLAFPGQYAHDIKEGKREYTVRPTNMAVEPDQVVTAMTYGGSPICKIKIISKETMSLGRIHKAFGKRMADSLEKRFGPGRRFTVIRFQRFDIRDADDGDDDSKWKEVLIDKEGTSLTRDQIRDHYSKPAIRKQIMARIKGKPALVYIGTSKNEKILKRNHDGKPIVITGDESSGDENPSNYWYWVKRRLLSIHEVLSTKTDHGFVDLDLHGGYPLAKAKEYASKLAPKISAKYGKAEIWQSGGEGLHVEFKLREPMSVDKLRTELRALLDEFNEDFEGVTTGIVKGKGMRSDVSTLHNKGGLRAPGAIGETWGRVKKKLSGGQSENDDDYGNNNFGEKHDYKDEPLEGGVFTERPMTSVAPGQPGVWHASLKRKDLFRRAGDSVK